MPGLKSADRGGVAVDSAGKNLMTAFCVSESYAKAHHLAVFNQVPKNEIDNFVSPPVHNFPKNGEVGQVQEPPPAPGTVDPFTLGPYEYEYHPDVFKENDDGSAMTFNEPDELALLPASLRKSPYAVSAYLLTYRFDPKFEWFWIQRVPDHEVAAAAKIYTPDYLDPQLLKVIPKTKGDKIFEEFEPKPLPAFHMPLTGGWFEQGFDGDSFSGFFKDGVDTRTGSLGAITLPHSLAGTLKRGRDARLKRDWPNGARLYNHAARLIRGDKKRNLLYSAIADLYAGFFDRAWAKFETLHDQYPDDPEMAREIAHAYCARERLSEECIWLSRYMRIAPDWESFENAYYFRDGLRSPPYSSGSNAGCKEFMFQWPAAKLPLKVYFARNKSDPAAFELFKKSMISSFDLWMEALEGRMDYQIVNDPKLADIKCQIGSEQQLNYLNYKDKSHAPDLHISPPELGLTFTDFQVVGDKKIPKKSYIDIYMQGDDNAAQDATVVAATCDHEVGHALGFNLHTSHPRDIMFTPPTDRLPERKPINAVERRRLLEAYKNYPITESAMYKHVQMRAVREKLILPEQNIVSNIPEGGIVTPDTMP